MPLSITDITLSNNRLDFMQMSVIPHQDRHVLKATGSDCGNHISSLKSASVAYIIDTVTVLSICNASDFIGDFSVRIWHCLYSLFKSIHILHIFAFEWVSNNQRNWRLKPVIHSPHSLIPGITCVMLAILPTLCAA